MGYNQALRAVFRSQPSKFLHGTKMGWASLFDYMRVLRLVRHHGIFFSIRFKATGGGRMSKFRRPVEDIIKVGSGYGALSKYWFNHIENGRWVPGQIDGKGQHRGIDFLTPIGTPVYAMCDGLVDAHGQESPDLRIGFGIRVRQCVKDMPGYKVWYGHLSRTDVRAGQFITKGTLIGLSGNSGRSSGPHLHVELRDTEGQSYPITFEENKKEITTNEEPHQQNQTYLEGAGDSIGSDSNQK